MNRYSNELQSIKVVDICGEQVAIWKFVIQMLKNIYNYRKCINIFFWNRDYRERVISWNGYSSSRWIKINFITPPSKNGCFYVSLGRFKKLRKSIDSTIGILVHRFCSIGFWSNFPPKLFPFSFSAEYRRANWCNGGIVNFILLICGCYAEIPT